MEDDPLHDYLRKLHVAAQSREVRTRLLVPARVLSSANGQVSSENELDDDDALHTVMRKLRVGAGVVTYGGAIVWLFSLHEHLNSAEHRDPLPLHGLQGWADPFTQS